MIDLKTYKTNLFKITHLLKPERTILISPAPVDEKVQFARTNEVLSNYASAVKHTGSHFIDFFSELISLED